MGHIRHGRYLVVIPLKICMQEIWKTGLDWDISLPAEVVLPYEQWREGLVLLRHFSMPRKAANLVHAEKELHVFCDASEKAHGSVVFLREVCSENEEVRVNFLTAKAKVAPLKVMTIPKLELQAALTGVLLIEAVLHAMRFAEFQPKVFYW